MVYECPRCHYHTLNKYHYISHLKKKKPCPSLYSECDTATVLESIQTKERLYKQHTCKECNKCFSHASGLSRHMKTHIEINNCHNNTTTNTSNSHNTTNTINSNNPTTNNITISPVINLNLFGQEKIDYILQDKEFLTECLKDILRCGIPNILEKMHFNKDVPENQNVKFKREHHPKKMSVYTQDNNDDVPEWKVKDLDIVIKEMIDNSLSKFLIPHKNELYNNFPKPTDREQRETDHMRTERIANIKSKKKGVYGPVKNGVVDMTKRFSS